MYRVNGKLLLFNVAPSANVTTIRVERTNESLALWVIPHKGGEMSAKQTKGTARPRVAPLGDGEGYFRIQKALSVS